MAVSTLFHSILYHLYISVLPFYDAGIRRTHRTKLPQGRYHSSQRQKSCRWPQRTHRRAKARNQVRFYTLSYSWNNLQNESFFQSIFPQDDVILCQQTLYLYNQSSHDVHAEKHSICSIPMAAALSMPRNSKLQCGTHFYIFLCITPPHQTVQKPSNHPPSQTNARRPNNTTTK